WTPAPSTSPPPVSRQHAYLVRYLVLSRSSLYVRTLGRGADPRADDPQQRADPADRTREGDRSGDGGAREEALFRSAPVEVRLHLVQLVSQPEHGRVRQPPVVGGPRMAAGPDQLAHRAELEPERGAVLGWPRARPEGTGGRTNRQPRRDGLHPRTGGRRGCVDSRLRRPVRGGVRQPRDRHRPD